MSAEGRTPPPTDVDERGYVYIVDRANTGLHILRVTGEAREIATLPK